MYPREVGAFHPAMLQGIIGRGAQTSEEVLLATDRPRTNDRRETQIRLRDVIPQAGVMRIKEEVNPATITKEILERLSEGNDAQAGHSRDATAMARAFEPLNRSLETFLARLSRTIERSEKSRRVFEKPRCYEDESDGCKHTCIEVIKLHFEEEDLTERQESSALTNNLEGAALNCVVTKNRYQRDTAEKVFEIMLNRFGSRVQGHQARMRIEKRRQREDETIDKFLDDLEMLRNRIQPDESNSRMNLVKASKFIDGVKNDELRTMLSRHYTPTSTNAPTPEKLRIKSKEDLLMKPPMGSSYFKKKQLWQI